MNNNNNFSKEYEEGFLPLNSRLVDSNAMMMHNNYNSNQLSSSVSSGSVSSYSSYNDTMDSISMFNNNGGLSGGTGSSSQFGGSGSGSGIVTGSGFFGSGSASGSSFGFGAEGDECSNELKFGLQRVGKEKSFGFLNIWGNDMSVWA